MGALDGRVALVTGGSKGLGAATAVRGGGTRLVVMFANGAAGAELFLLLRFECMAYPWLPRSLGIVDG